jgi:phosphohistidine phosphatase
MLVYLVRHGEALSEEEEYSRPLSEPGRYHVHLICDLLASSISIMPGYIYHSPKTRAAQTAALISEALSGSPPPSVQPGLLPQDDPSIWGVLLPDTDKDVLLVGHLPHLSRLASLLLLRDPGREIIDFSPGAVLCLEKSAGWRVKWLLSPRVLKGKKNL